MSASGRVIPRDALGEVRRWELPSVDDPEPPLPPQAEPVPEAVEPEPAAFVELPPPAEPAIEPEPEPAPLPALPTLEEIEAIQREAQAEGYQAGFEQGFAEGRERGHAAGLAATEAEVRAQFAALQGGLDALAVPLARLDAAVEDELVQLVIAIARQFVRRELRAAPGEIVALVRETVALLPLANRPVQVRLHPDDARLLRERGGSGEVAAWELVDDPTLARGGCVVEAAESRIDASVEARLNTVIATLLGGERDEDAPHEPA